MAIGEGERSGSIFGFSKLILCQLSRHESQFTSHRTSDITSQLKKKLKKRTKQAKIEKKLIDFRFFEGDH